ncbi:MAG: Hint domain-containing protein [Shimia sp.]
MSETGDIPTITGVTGNLPTEWVGQSLAFGWQSSVNDNDDPDILGLMIGGPHSWVFDYVVQYPGGETLVKGQEYKVKLYENVPKEVAMCFCRGTLIETRDGHTAVEDLVAGDLVLTQDRGLQAIQWIGSFKIEAIGLRRNPKLKPVRITQGSLGFGLPNRDLLVSRQHRVLVSSRIAERTCGSRQVLIPAIKLTSLPGIYVDESVTEVTYYHFLFDQHEVVFSEGAPTESLHTGPEALKSVSPAALKEILTLFPELASKTNARNPARSIPNHKLQKQLVTRHLKNQKPLLQIPPTPPP